MATEHLPPLDLAFWRIESASHPMHLGALGVFEAAGPDAAARAAELIAERCADVPRLRRRIHDVLLPVGAAAWSPAQDFDPARHVFLVPHADADPHAAAGPLMARPLERGLPPWEAHVLAGPDPDTFAVLFKFHHALSDGLGVLALAAGLFDEGLPVRGSARPADRAPRRGAGGPVPAPAPGSALRRLPGTLAARAQDVGQALEIGAAVARSGLPFGVPDGLSAEGGAAAGTRALAGVALDLDDVNRVRKVAGGTVNDVLIALVAGALRRWLAGRGEPVGDASGPRALIPVARRRAPGGSGASTGSGAGNRLSGYLLRLPVAESEPLRRLGAVRLAMDRNKEAGPARGAGAVALLADHVHPLGHRLGGPLLAQAARLLFDILVTSVPLPGLTFSLGGSAVREIYPLAPLAQGHALAVAVSSYRGTVHYGLVADGAAVPDLDALAGALRTELEELVREVS
ncbi:wax ester/triacylglycerol synthase family O-acyltransferase [Streptomyces sp. NBC_00536]|uniref:wax ester/triacylglycerol synthase family O-acyltransferase n=1 Tax=Streptomyces sp. NBC_00536 TaxID=2975769 RepID=UPI002E8138C0|nr:wax ester/triacylglycerol synthase family O-acyltransferase [Streptomyces sp. NBC_00536]WUC77635.1 wax ester/triacylglycerol synthase family O-acyltransferase [Streptomyces sp. NBC_00536]